MVFPIEAHEFEGVADYINLIDEHPEKNGVAFLCSKPGEMLVKFCAEFEEIKAAGGLVVNTKSEVLLIKRRGFWDLPKGKVENGEFLRQAAVREVREECGVQKLKVVSTIKPTFHIYPINQVLVLKTTYWYLMECSDPENTLPQAEEEIEEVKWVSQADLAPYMENTFDNIKILLALFATMKFDYSGLD